ncbi:hypothetical protein ACIPX0_12325 [Streptomyces sp. NPDC090075]|uniref:hypothetical protein n=1 Tax=Streptomyces sp. NPDC090075 TaxID=3365937 RepID=UPI00382CD598
MTDLLINGHNRARLLALIANQPGLTIDEHEAAARIVDRSMIRPGFVALVDQRVIRRDENGRLWPAGLT